MKSGTNPNGILVITCSRAKRDPRKKDQRRLGVTNGRGRKLVHVFAMKSGDGWEIERQWIIVRKASRPMFTFVAGSRVVAAPTEKVARKYFPRGVVPERMGREPHGTPEGVILDEVNDGWEGCDV